MKLSFLLEQGTTSETVKETTVHNNTTVNTKAEAPKQATNESKTDSTNPTIAISLAETKKNPEYWGFFENGITEQYLKLANPAQAPKNITPLAVSTLATDFSFDEAKTVSDLTTDDTPKTDTPNLQPKSIVSEPTSSTIVNEQPLELAVIKEPTDPAMALQHAKGIKDHWKLNFKDSVFTGNITKALRLEHINADEAATAILLKDARVELSDLKQENPIRRFSFSEGPLGFEKILGFICPMMEFLQDSNLKARAQQFKQRFVGKFKQRLTQLAPSEQCYFTIDFSKRNEDFFIYFYLNFGTNLELKYPGNKFDKILAQYISRRKDAKALSKKHLEIKKSQQNYKELSDDLFQKDPSYQWLYTFKTKNLDKTTKKDIMGDSFHLFLNSMHDSEYCWFDISPNYKDGDPNSPLVCLLLPNVAAFKQLLQVLHPDNYTEPKFVFGKFSLRYLRRLHEQRDLHGKPHPARAVELVHPDFVAGTMPHGHRSLNFTIAFHDLGYHIPHNCHCPIPDLLIYLKQLLAQERGFNMSKSIMNLTDGKLNIDPYYVSYSLIINLFSEDKNVKNLIRTIRKKLIIEFLEDWFHEQWGLGEEGNLWQYPDATDNYLLVIIDMINNKLQWEKLLGEPLPQFLKNYANEFAQAKDDLMVFSDNLFSQIMQTPIPYLGRHEFIPDFTTFFAVYAEMEKLITKIEAKPVESKSTTTTIKTKPSWFYIVMYRLQNHPGALELCESILTHDSKAASNQDKILLWSKNEGLYINEKLTNSKYRQISLFLDSTELFKRLNFALEFSLKRQKQNVALLQENTLPDSLLNIRRDWHLLAEKGHFLAIRESWKLLTDPLLFAQYLHVSASFEYLILIWSLVNEFQVNVNCTNKEGKTAIELARERNKTHAVELLIKLKADPKLPESKSTSVVNGTALNDQTVPKVFPAIVPLKAKTEAKAETSAVAQNDTSAPLPALSKSAKKKVRKKQKAAEVSRAQSTAPAKKTEKVFTFTL